MYVYIYICKNKKTFITKNPKDKWNDENKLKTKKRLKQCKEKYSKKGV